MDKNITLEQINDLYLMLQGEGGLPEGCSLGHKFRMSDKKAFTVIWYMQEILRIIPDTYERCDDCGDLFDSNSSGYYSEKRGKHFCSSCDDGEEDNDV
jgi:hypothetical protein